MSITSSICPSFSLSKGKLYEFGVYSSKSFVYSFMYSCMYQFNFKYMISLYVSFLPNKNYNILCNLIYSDKNTSCGIIFVYKDLSHFS